MASDYISNADKGMEINATLLYLQTLLSNPSLNIPANELNDIHERVRQSQEILNSLAGTRINTVSVVGSIAESSQISLIHLANRELQNIARQKLGDKFSRVEIVFDMSKNNIVTGKMYKILGIAHTLRNEVYLLGLNENGHYAFSDLSNWEDIPTA